MNISSPCCIECGRGDCILESCFAVYFGNQAVGKVRVTKQGLYYHFSCRCRIGAEIVCRLAVSCGEKRENLGIVVPVDGGFGLDTKIPIKRLEEGKMEFFLIPKHDVSDGQAVRVYPEEPFAYISRLKDAYLVKQKGQPYIVIK